MGVPLNHPFMVGFSTISHPFGGYPHCRKARKNLWNGTHPERCRVSRCSRWPVLPSWPTPIRRRSPCASRAEAPALARCWPFRRWCCGRCTAASRSVDTCHSWKIPSSLAFFGYFLLVSGKFLILIWRFWMGSQTVGWWEILWFKLGYLMLSC